MKVSWKLLLATALPLLVSAKSSEDRFAIHNAKQVSQSGPVSLNDASFAELTKAPRNYTVAVLLTALEPRFDCGACRLFQPEWNLLGKSWVKGDKNQESRLLLGTLDFSKGKNTFQTLMLQSAPKVALLHPTVGPHARPGGPPLLFDFSAGTTTAEPVHAWISRQLTDRPHPPIVRPVDYVKLAVVTTSILGLVTFFSVAAPYIMPIIQNRNLWAAMSLIAVLLFTSGQMFNHIRRVPYMVPNSKGGVAYFAGGFQNQFGIETQIVAAMYGVLAFATIRLALKAPRISDPRSQQVSIFIWGGVILCMYSFLLSVFRMKNGSYPFWLPPF